MAAKRKAEIVDGFTALRAAQRVEKHSGARKEPDAAATPVPATEGSLGAKHVHRTVQPTRYDLTCYECGFRFKLSGRPRNTHCPKCRGVIDLGDHVIDGPWSETLRTGGKIHGTPQGVVSAGTLVAGDLLLEGQLDGGSVEATHLLLLGPGARFSLDAVKAEDIQVTAGAEIALEGEAVFRNVTLEGRLRARLKADGVLTIRAGGCLEGRFEGAHLVVEEGGGLLAEVCVKQEDPV